MVLLEPVCSGAGLYQTATQLLADSQRLQDMSRAMSSMGVPDAAEKIYDTLTSLLRKS